MADELSDENLHAMARAKIKAGKLPVKSTDGLRRASDPKRMNFCVVCDKPLPTELHSWQITDFPGGPEMHHPRCFNAWLHAARDELS
ncbi:MAG: hypothetical protein ACLPV8_29220 [Steroidobacteraceae bacterium]